MEEQQFNLREGAEIIIATPGRLKDVLERHVIVLSQCRYIVMDEADRMVHLGFEADLLFILDKLPSDALEGEQIGGPESAMDVDGEEGNAKGKGRSRVTTLFSATMPPAVERLARKYLKRPATITIGEAGRAVDTVEQRVEFVIGDEKKKLACSVISWNITDRRDVDSVCWRSSTAGYTSRLSLCLSTRRRRRTWWRRIYHVQACVDDLHRFLGCD